jgi:hypothetical protein
MCLTALTSLELEGAQPRVLSTCIAHLTQLSELKAFGLTDFDEPNPADFMVLKDMAPLAALTRLTQLRIAGGQSQACFQDTSIWLHNEVSLARTVGWYRAFLLGQVWGPFSEVHVPFVSGSAWAKA